MTAAADQPLSGVRGLLLDVDGVLHVGRQAIPGAAGFLNKESAPAKLTEATRRVASGGRYVSAALAETLASLLSGDAQGLPHDCLSDREFEILKLLASGKTVTDVAESLALSVKTISTHRARILKKMNMRTNAELTHYAVRQGLVS